MAKIYIRFEIIGSGNLDYRNIVSARLVKDRYTPYSELRASVVLNNSINLNNIRRVALYIGSKRMHYGPADYIRTRVRGGKTVLELISRGITLMLGQNEPEPGVWSKVSLTDLSARETKITASDTAITQDLCLGISTTILRIKRLEMCMKFLFTRSKAVLIPCLRSQV